MPYLLISSRRLISTPYRRLISTSILKASKASILMEKGHQEFSNVGETKRKKKALSRFSPQCYEAVITTDVVCFVKHWGMLQKGRRSKEDSSSKTCLFRKQFMGLELLPTDEHPFDLITMDTIGVLFGYGSAKVFVTDYATRYVWEFCQKHETDVYISCFAVRCAAGRPRKFLSNPGKVFTANTFKHYLKNNTIQQLPTLSRHPQCNDMN